ncbi:hypothetical protein ACJMK2_040950 [Sinanodonta woodiana]|uniref:Uncharacterized protein n=1 Tax=Sinanodonta woodiana TaxID=1069815 RepID=A0ABD3W2K4_SINWO
MSSHMLISDDRSFQLGRSRNPINRRSSSPIIPRTPSPRSSSRGTSPVPDGSELFKSVMEQIEKEHEILEKFQGKGKPNNESDIEMDDLNFNDLFVDQSAEDSKRSERLKKLDGIIATKHSRQSENLPDERNSDFRDSQGHHVHWVDEEGEKDVVTGIIEPCCVVDSCNCIPSPGTSPKPILKHKANCVIVISNSG